VDSQDPNLDFKDLGWKIEFLGKHGVKLGLYIHPFLTRF
jgi:hypothetical protein